MKTTHTFAMFLLALLLAGVGAFSLFTTPREMSMTEPSTTDTPAPATATSSSTSTAEIPPEFFNPDGNAAPLPEVLPSDEMPRNDMRLTFNDDFNSFSRYTDGKGGISCEAGGVGTWQTVYHFCSRTIASNFENEIYIDQNFIDYLNSRAATPTAAVSPFSVADGILTIEARPSDEPIIKAAGWWARYTSGLITTQFSFSQQYGYFEMRAKLPRGKGLWPAFWLLPIDKSWPPEIDAMEAFGGPNHRGEGSLTKIHYASHEITKKCGSWVDIGTDISQNFHRYGVLWEPDKITYYFDGKPYGTCPGNKDANQPFYMLVNLAVGGEGSWPGTPTTTNEWPAFMHVDYVRAYAY